MIRRVALAFAIAACSSTPHAVTAVEPPPTPTELPEEPMTSTGEIELPIVESTDPTASSPGTPGARMRVVIISEDGMRPDALDAETAPNHLALMRAGMVPRSASTIKPSETLASHASMLSGFAAADHKMVFDAYQRTRGQIALPTIFSIARAHGLSTAMFIGKQKLWHIAPTGSVDHFEKAGFFCRTVAVRAAKYFESDKPDVMFVHITDPDNAGHERGWMSPAYITAVRESDRCLGILIDAIDRSGTPTLLIVTADHGGSKRQHSGRGKELDSRIPWIARGPGIQPGSVLEVDISTVDTAATVLAALKLPAHPRMVGVSRFPAQP